MRGPKPKYPIILTTEERDSIEQIVKSRKSAQGKVLRAQIILKTADHPDWTNRQLGREVGCTDRAVRKRRRRWVESQARMIYPGRARPVLRLYEQAPALLKAGLGVVCVDEKTSIQARQREQTPQPTQAGQTAHLSPRYKRQGFLHLFAGLSVADGYKYSQPFSCKRFIDFQTFLLKTIIPEVLRRGLRTLTTPPSN